VGTKKKILPLLVPQLAAIQHVLAELMQLTHNQNTNINESQITGYSSLDSTYFPNRFFVIFILYLNAVYIQLLQIHFKNTVCGCSVKHTDTSHCTE
jgi:hypothetical protein